MNQKRYWLRFASIATLLHLILWIVTLLISTSTNESVGRAFVWMWLGLLDIPVAYLGEFLSLGSILDGIAGVAVWLLLLGTIQWFLIGGLIGILYKKIRNL
jgi:hypothetical protein